METLQQIVITDEQQKKYRSTIILGRLDSSGWIVIITTENKGVVQQYKELHEIFANALDYFLQQIHIYAKHTALMNL